MKQQHSLMKFDPSTGEPRPYPSHAEQWRDWYGKHTAWLFDPWSGYRRCAGDVGADPFGHLIVPPGEPVYPETEDVEREKLLQVSRDLNNLRSKIDAILWPNSGMAVAGKE